ncbi:MAG: hypothetical protein E6447_16520 [Bradyrhizobium sp.]|nr:hypothetical protein [Bradyrhizobium sp.]
MLATAAFATLLATSAFAADLPGVHDKVLHYKARRAVKAPPPAVIVKDEDSLISPMLPSTPLLLGRQELPGYYGGEGYTNYMFRLPYACGVTGYC